MHLIKFSCATGRATSRRKRELLRLPDPEDPNTTKERDKVDPLARVHTVPAPNGTESQSLSILENGKGYTTKEGFSRFHDGEALFSCKGFRMLFRYALTVNGKHKSHCPHDCHHTTKY